MYKSVPEGSLGCLGLGIGEMRSFLYLQSFQEMNHLARTTNMDAGDIHQSATNNLPQIVSATMPGPKLCKKMVQRARKRAAGENLGKAPKQLTGWAVPAVLTELPNDGGNFLLWDSGEDDPERILIFGTPAMVERLRDVHEFYSDGTFPKCVFFQLYSIHAPVVGVDHTVKVYTLKVNIQVYTL